MWGRKEVWRIKKGTSEMTFGVGSLVVGESVVPSVGLGWVGWAGMRGQMDPFGLELDLFGPR